MSQPIVERNYSVEALRCLLMFLIVFQHNFSFGIFTEGSSEIDLGWWCLPFAFIRWRVDAFVAISGWFGISFKWSKFLKLFGVIVVYSVISVCYQIVALKSCPSWKSQLVDGGWYGGTYLMLMLMAPFLNAGVDYLVQRGARFAFSVWILIAIGITLNWSPLTRGLTGVCPSGAGTYSILTMMFVYVSARLARLLKLRWSLRRLLIAGGIILVVGVSVCGGVNALSFAVRRMPITGMCIGGFSTYDAPHIWSFAIVIIMIFAYYVRVPKIVATVARFVGPSTFPIFLIHFVVVFGKDIYRTMQFWQVGVLGHRPLLIVFTSTCGMFVLCLAIDLLRRMLIIPFRSSLNRWLKMIDDHWTLKFL